MAADGRGFSITGPGILPFDAVFEATVEVDGQRRTLLSRNGTSGGPVGLSVEVTPFGNAQVTTAALRFEDERLDLHVRLSRLPGVPAVVARVGIRNAGPRPIRLWSLTPLDADVQVVGDPSNWLVTPLDKSTESTASPAVALEDIRDTLKVHEYGGLYRQDGLGFLFGPVGEPVAYLETTVTHGGNGKARVKVTAGMSGVDVDPGETRWGQQAVLLLEPPRQALPRWAEWVAKTHGALTDKGALAGWCSWYHLTDRIAGKDVLGIVDAVLTSEGRLRPEVIQIDDGYQDIDGEWDANAKFPEGLPFYAQRIAATGARPGLWIAPMLVCPDTPWVKDPANLAAVRGQKFDPPSGSRFRGSGWLDPTHPRAQEYIADRIRHAVRSGFTYLKLDFNNVGGGNWYEKKKTSFEIKRDYCANIRQAAGEGTYILFCAPEPDRATVGLVDASRTGHDAWRGGVRSAMQDVLRSFQLHGRWFAVDNDCYYLATDVPDIGNIAGGWPLVKTWISMTGLSCGAAFTSDPWHWDSFKPHWSIVEVLTPPARERTEVLDLGTDRDWPRLVGVVKREWGTAAVALLWNPAATEHNVKLDFAQAGLDPRREYAVWSFWDEKFLGFAKGSWTTPALPPGGSQHLCLTEVDRTRGTPALVGSSLHIYCGAAEIERFRAERTAVEIDLTDAGARAGNLFVYSPARLILRNASGCSVGAIERAGEDVWRIPVAQRQPGRPQRIGLAIAVPLTRQPRFWALTGVAALGAGFGIWWYVQRQRTRLALARVEHQHAMERERFRIARDIHDDLGASLTHIALLSEMAQADAEDPRATRTHVDEIFHTAHTLTRAVDEIVWAVNPANDTIEKFAAFIGPFAQRFLGSAGVSCHIELPDELPPAPMPAAARHQLFLALKEALRNVVSHAGARAVRLAFSLEGEQLTLIVADDGRGFDPQAAGARPGGGHGLANMRQRMAAIGGSLDVQSAPGNGATVTMRLKLDRGTRP